MGVLSMENSPIEPIAYANKPVTPLAEARFMDPLEPEYEKLWQDIMLQVEIADEGIEKAMIPIWSDSSYPQAFRDRAMMAAVGPSKFLRQFGVSQVRSDYITMGWYPTTVNGLSDYDPTARSAFEFAERFNAWLRDEVSYKKNHPEVVGISGSDVYDWAIELYGLKTIDEDGLDYYLNSLSKKALNKLSPLVEDEWDGGYFRPDTKQAFPVLPGLIKARGKFPRYMDYAGNKLRQWILYKSGGETDLPDWLKNATDEQGSDFFATLYAPDNKILTGEIKLLAVRRFGVDKLFDYAENGLAKLDYFEDDGIKLQIAERIINLREEERQKYGEHARPLKISEINKLQALFSSADRKDLLARLEPEAQLTEERRAQSEAYERRRAAERQRDFEADPRVIVQGVAKRALEGLLDQVRTL